VIAIKNHWACFCRLDYGYGSWLFGI